MFNAPYKNELIIIMVTGNENIVLSELHKTVYATGLKLHFKLLRLNYFFFFVWRKRA